MAKPRSTAAVGETSPVVLTVHPILHDHPQWADDSEEFTAFCRDIAKHGIDHPLLVDSRNRIVDGRQRWRAAKLLKLPTVPVRAVEEDEIADTVLHCILARRHYTRGALVYMSLPIIQSHYTGGSKSMELVATDLGFCSRQVRQAIQLREIFASDDLGEKYRAEVEPRILSGDIGLGAAVAGWAGLKATAGQKKTIRAALDLWDRGFKQLRTRFAAWDRFDEETKAQAAAKLSPLVESMPADLLQKFRDRCNAELKQRKENQ